MIPIVRYLPYCEILGYQSFVVFPVNIQVSWYIIIDNVLQILCSTYTFSLYSIIYFSSKLIWGYQILVPSKKKMFQVTWQWIVSHVFWKILIFYASNNARVSGLFSSKCCPNVVHCLPYCCLISVVLEHGNSQTLLDSGQKKVHHWEKHRLCPNNVGSLTSNNMYMYIYKICPFFWMPILQH